MNYDLSILIPARNEMFLSKTVEDILMNKRGKTEIIVGLDGQWSNPAIEQHPDVTIVYYPESIGQRAMTNKLARISKAKYLIKTDAHCAFDEGFDIKLMSKMQDDYTMVPIMRNLHAFDWVCTNGHRRYQGPSGNCQTCGESTERDIVWIAKRSPQSTSYCFDPSPHFQYFNGWKKTEKYKSQGSLTETMSLQGSFFMITREKYWELNICDENFGSWGSQGIEVAVKTWLSGGRVVCNHDTWYAHMFRTQGGDFGFPYKITGSQQKRAQDLARDMFFKGNWKAKRPLSWLIEKFWPVPYWSQEELNNLITIESQSYNNTVDSTQVEEPLKIGKVTGITIKKKPSKGVVYYTDNDIDPKLFETCQKQILKGIKEKHIVSVSLKPIGFGTNIIIPSQRGYITMTKQILTGVKKSQSDVIFLCEHDVLYHPTHFDFVPLEQSKFYYNVNVWRIRISDGYAIKTDDCRQLSGLCAYRSLLLEYLEKRLQLLEMANVNTSEEEFNKYVRLMGFEPGTHNRIMNLKYESTIYSSNFSNLDIRHDKNLTPSRWSKDQFRNQKFTKGWTESNINKIEGWSNLNYSIK